MPGDVDTAGLSIYDVITSNNWYIYRNHPKLKQSILETLSQLEEIGQIAQTDNKRAMRHLTRLVPGISETADINYPFHIEYPFQVVLGDLTYIGPNFQVISSGKVTIGKNCFIGPFCSIYTPNHHPSNVKLRRAGWQYDAPVTIGDDVWFGGSVTVCPGVTIGNNVVVGAGSVVTKDFPDNVLIGGNPAQIIKELEPEEKCEHSATNITPEQNEMSQNG